MARHNTEQLQCHVEGDGGLGLGCPISRPTGLGPPPEVLGWQRGFPPENLHSGPEAWGSCDIWGPNDIDYSRQRHGLVWWRLSNTGVEVRISARGSHTDSDDQRVILFYVLD